MDFLDFRDAMQKLPLDQREALILVAASGLSYEEAAEICGCAPGTMKSRVNRARNRLSELMSAAPAAERREWSSAEQWTEATRD
jgi:RNA polymerase sigma-70 factor (ECF subfamily)